MENRWDDGRRFEGGLDECAYGSRLIGSDPSLVLHGGGNTSVKVPFVDITGEEIPALWVKGSGCDLASIQLAGFPPLRQHRLLDLLALRKLSDPEMMRELSAARLDPDSPQPSVESMLHAFLPYPAVQHSHADVIVTLTNLADGAAIVRKVFGDDVVVVPYVMPGFDLARAVRDLWPSQVNDQTVGMVLLNHGLFTFGSSTREAYDRHVDLITRAEDWLALNAPASVAADEPLGPVDPVTLAGLRHDVSRVAGIPLVMIRHSDRAVAMPNHHQRNASHPRHVMSKPGEGDRVDWTKRLVRRHRSRCIEREPVLGSRDEIDVAVIGLPGRRPKGE